MEKTILIKYGELTTKKENRKFFIKILASNIKNLLKNYDISLDYDRVRMYVKVKDQTKVEEVANKLSKIFGIHSIVICHKESE